MKRIVPDSKIDTFSMNKHYIKIPIKTKSNLETKISYTSGQNGCDCPRK